MHERILQRRSPSLLPCTFRSGRDVCPNRDVAKEDVEQYMKAPTFPTIRVCVLPQIEILRKVEIVT